MPNFQQKSYKLTNLDLTFFYKTFITVYVGILSKEIKTPEINQNLIHNTIQCFYLQMLKFMKKNIVHDYLVYLYHKKM